jgi:uncharacterized protein YjbI with pentapeptide repeats
MTSTTAPPAVRQRVDQLLSAYAQGRRDFQQWDLTDADLSQCELRGANLSGAILRRANLPRIGQSAPA